MTPMQTPSTYVQVHTKTLERRSIGNILDNIFTFNQTEDRDAGNKALVEAILIDEIISDWTARGIIYTKPSVTSSRNKLDITFNIHHPQKGIQVFAINRKWDGTGRITISSKSNSTGYNLPNDAEETIKRLQEIIIEATSTQTTH